jgi:N-acetyl sugar amidotransferase
VEPDPAALSASRSMEVDIQPATLGAMTKIAPPEMRYCVRCVYPAASAAPLAFDDDGVCSGCRVAAQKDRIDWDDRLEELKELVEEYRSKDGSNYDCVIPVSGGKDSHFQTYFATQVLGLRPLLVTYHGNNYLDVGLRNLRNLRERFGVDHIFFSPSVPVLQKMNRLCFRMMGDMNWHAHCGIFTYPVQIAVKHRIPLMLWGEHGFMDLAGMYSHNDRIEMTAKYRLEHAQRGYDWHDMIEETEGLTQQDLLWAKYPTDEELAEVGVRGIYLANYVNWEANEQTELMVNEWGFEPSPEPFERTYRRMSNLDDMHENGAHDYLKYVKFGYGRGTDHACKDIRAGKLTREEGVEMVRRYDPVKPMKDLTRWLEYVGMSEQEFDEIADTFRDPRVWVKDSGGEWIKDNIWDFDARRAGDRVAA